MAVIKRASYLAVWLVLILLGAASGGCTRAEPGVEIPLDVIWTYNMPGTPTTQPLGSELIGSSLSQQISAAIYHRFEENQSTGPGFAVEGSGLEALKVVKEILEEDRMPSQTFSAGTDVSLFFFTRELGPYVQIKKVRQCKKAVTIYYQFATERPLGMQIFTPTYYFALIPLGKPMAGNITVNIIEFPLNQKDKKRYRPMSRELVKKLICKPFRFSIESPVSEVKINE